MAIEATVEIPTRGGEEVAGDLVIPPGASGLVVFAHGSGSSRHSPRNREVAAALREHGLGTLLMDLLTAAEDRVDQVTREHRFDIARLAERLADATAWLRAERRIDLPLPYFGASTGAAAALVAAARSPEGISSVVSRGGRPDLAGELLAAVQAPTLLIVGSRDPVVIDLNRAAADRMHCERRISIVPGATHLFEEPGTLDVVKALAAEWFVTHLPSGG